MKPVKIFSDAIEGKALAQFHDAMSMGFAVQGALMPDAHAGYALPIGAVVATDGVVVPAWVGYDIGCGMCAIPTLFKREEVETNKKAIFDQIYRDVPVGFNHNSKPVDWSYEGRISDFAAKLYASGACEKQIGSLGSGNHFIEIGYDERDTVWIVIHSGSRGVGHKLATHYMKLASKSDKAKEWHYGLDVSSPDGKNYINDLAFGLQFALDNRKTMLNRISWAIHHVGCGGALLWLDLINRNHNHAELKDDRWIHRKGATHAEDGMMGVIPGNMRDGSFIVRGKGNPDSLFSSSHGAGRVMSRTEAKSTLSVATFVEQMEASGVQAKVGFDTVDESPLAYKSIFDVMAMQTDLVEVVHHIKPIINIKG